jgi:hypothetical protein
MLHRFSTFRRFEVRVVLEMMMQTSCFLKPTALLALTNPNARAYSYRDSNMDTLHGPGTKATDTTLMAELVLVEECGSADSPHGTALS